MKMDVSIDTPKVFISYSWKPEINKQRALKLATRLENEGVHVIIDVWNLSEGQDKYQFMEKMVNDPEVNKVLLVCNKQYTEKANKKIGGVGIESLIISDEIYKKAEQKKFIPIIFERDESGNEFVPTFIKSRIYIDLSNDDIYEEEYEKLMRNLFNKPANKRPPRGIPPAYILEESPTFLKTSFKVAAIKASLLNEKRNSQILINEYYDTFVNSLNDFVITSTDTVGKLIDDVVYQRIENLKSLRDDYIDFMETLFAYSVFVDMDQFLRFIESLLSFQIIRDSERYQTGTIGQYLNDHYKFFFYELFLYTVAIMIDKERYAELGDVIHNDFIINNENLRSVEILSFSYMNQYVGSLNDLRNKRLEMRRISVTADIIKQRADNNKYPFNKIMEADALLYYLSQLRHQNKEQWRWPGWLPYTTVYDLHRVSILDKMISLRFFNKIKPIFRVATIDELKIKIESIKDSLQRPGYNYYFPALNVAFDFNKIGSYN